MPRSSELLSDALHLLHEAGFEPQIEHSRHVKVRWCDSDGRSHCVVISRSPSCARARQNNRALLRHLLRGGSP